MYGTLKWAIMAHFLQAEDDAAAQKSGLTLVWFASQTGDAGAVGELLAGGADADRGNVDDFAKYAYAARDS